MPEMDSTTAPEAARERRGDDVCKLEATPSGILYTCDAEKDEMHADGLMRQRGLR